MTSKVNLRAAFVGIKDARAEPEQLQEGQQVATKEGDALKMPAAAPSTTETVAKTRMSRPMGKSRNPEFTQIGAYIRKATKKAAEIRLMQEDGERDLSDLIENLLHNWLSS